MKDISKIHQLKGLKPKNNDHMNFYECCDLTKKVYLIYIYKSNSMQEKFMKTIKEKTCCVLKLLYFGSFSSRASRFHRIIFATYIKNICGRVRRVRGTASA